jgi:hypothetical protein
MGSVEVAKQADDGGNYEEAFEKYQEALEHFMKASRGSSFVILFFSFFSSYIEKKNHLFWFWFIFETGVSNSDIKKSIDGMMSTYITRAEQIKAFLQEKKKEKKLQTLKAAKAEVSPQASK